MKRFIRPYIHTLLLFFLMLGLTQCASLSQFFSSAFRGNTKPNRQEYNIDEKKEYKGYLRNRKTQQEEEEQEILKRLQQSDNGEGSKPLDNRHNSTKSIYTKKRNKKSDDRNVIQKLLKTDDLFPSSR